MSNPLHVITGATGLIGSHVAEQLVERGERVRALVRASSDTAFLRRLGVETVVADLADPATLPAAVAGAGIVYHCAARVSDWGSWRLFQETMIDATRNLLEASQAARVGRFVYVSSSRVYGRPHQQTPLTEDDPLGQHLWRLWDYYPRAKIAAEELTRRYPGAWTIVRPTWVYGLRDRNTLPRMIRALELGQAGIVGSGDNPLNLVSAVDAADGILRTAAASAAAGRVYNLSAAQAITQRQFFDAVTSALGYPPLRRQVPAWLAYTTGFLVEVWGKTFRIRRNLRVTRHAVSLLYSPMRFSSARAEKELGWTARTAPLEGLQRTIAWHLANAAGPRTAAPAPGAARSP